MINATPQALDQRMQNLRGKVNTAKRKWRAESRVWIAGRAAEFIEKLYRGATEDLQITAGQIVAALDKLNAPAGYTYMMDNYPARYQFVRRVLQELVDEGTLATSQTYNSRNRPAASFHPASWKPAPKAQPPGPGAFEVVVDAESPALASSLQAQLLGFLAGTKLEGVHGLLITRTEVPEPEIAPDPTVKRRRTARGTGGNVG